MNGLIKFLTIMIFFAASSVLAGEYTATNALKYVITDGVETEDGTLIGLTAEGVWSDSRGNSGKVFCVGTRGKTLKALCNSTDQDGDVQNSTATRVGTEGRGVLSGGTGKYANVTGTCSYQLAAFDKESLVGLITLQCTDNQ